MSYKLIQLAEIECDQCGKTEIVGENFLINLSQDGRGSELGIQTRWYTENGWRHLQRTSMDFCSQSCVQDWLLDEGLI